MEKLRKWLCGCLIGLAAVVVGCGESMDSNSSDGEQMARFTLSWMLDESAGESMTRSAASDGWVKFYDAIRSGELVAEGYEITFANATSGQSYTFNGKWANHDMFVLPVGVYKVTGKSSASGEHVQSKCSLKFDTSINIDSDVTSLTLPAQYDCFLLAFVKTGIRTIINHYWEAHHTDGLAQDVLPTFDNYIYCFVNDKLPGQYYTTDYNYMSGQYTNGSSFRIETYNVSFVKGKYYIYSSIPSSFTVPEMTSGMDGVLSNDDNFGNL